MQVIFSEEAEQNIFRIFEYIAREASPRIAANYIHRVRMECDSLGISPHRGEFVSFRGHHYRRIGFEGRLTILFEVQSEAVVIAAVLGYGRNAIRPR
jgi:plasmid stabilization system protein ParE